jgi:hypothetical protein
MDEERLSKSTKSSVLLGGISAESRREYRRDYNSWRLDELVPCPVVNHTDLKIHSVVW